MPHICTRCGKEYKDGDPEILKGCKCGSNKFLYLPKDKKAKKVKKEFSGIESV
ncbi:MAG: hypothetical protein J7K36_06955, partial [Archaeoglobaceae archaeon]|nr:hypothetical protein [Archaeoglobaceae archaeon]